VTATVVVRVVDDADRLCPSERIGPGARRERCEHAGDEHADARPKLLTQSRYELDGRPGVGRDLLEANRLLDCAVRPVFLVGSQIRWSPAPESVRAAADALKVPFFLNGMARGALPYDHPCLFSLARRFALAHADVVFVFGTPFDFRVDYGRTPTWNAEAKIAQIDLDGAELGRNRRVDVALQADSGRSRAARAAGETWRVELPRFSGQVDYAA
jgi:thiamine pyrophosphate-dependent acetolactate synthase large subunit-like protein